LDSIAFAKNASIKSLLSKTKFVLDKLEKKKKKKKKKKKSVRQNNEKQEKKLINHKGALKSHFLEEIICHH